MKKWKRHSFVANEQFDATQVVNWKRHVTKHVSICLNGGGYGLVCYIWVRSHRFFISESINKMLYPLVKAQYDKLEYAYQTAADIDDDERACQEAAAAERAAGWDPRP